MKTARLTEKSGSAATGAASEHPSDAKSESSSDEEEPPVALPDTNPAAPNPARPNNAESVALLLAVEASLNERQGPVDRPPEPGATSSSPSSPPRRESESTGGGNEATYLAYAMPPERSGSCGVVGSRSRGGCGGVGAVADTAPVRVADPVLPTEPSLIEGVPVSGRRGGNEGESRRRKRRSFAIGAAVALLVVVAAAVAAAIVVVSSSSRSEPGDSVAPAAPAALKSDANATILSVVRGLSSPEDLSDPSSAQSRALEWLLSSLSSSSPASGGAGGEDEDPLLGAPSRITQRYILAVLFHATGGDGWWWVQSDGFLSHDTHECEWFGVGCGENGTFVRSLSFGRNNLTGTLSDEIKFLSNLTHFAADYNQLVGKLPAGMGHLFNLRYLNIGYNRLTGGLPDSIGDLVGLTYLSLSGNKLVGSIPRAFGGLRSLRHLSMARNALTGDINFISTLRELRYFSVQVNRLSNRIPHGVGDLESMVVFSLSANSFNGTIPESLSAMTNLDALDLSSNRLSGTIPASVANIRGLSGLLLEGNRLRGTIPPSIATMSHLTGLTVNYNELSGSIPPDIGAMTSLRILFLHSNHLTGVIPPNIGEISNLSFFDITDNPALSGTVPSTLGNLSRLAFLSMSKTNLTGSMDFLCPVPLLYADCGGPNADMTCGCCGAGDCCDGAADNPACSAHFFQFAFFIDPDFLASYETCTDDIYAGTVSHCDWGGMIDAYVTSNILS